MYRVTISPDYNGVVLFFVYLCPVVPTEFKRYAFYPEFRERFFFFFVYIGTDCFFYFRFYTNGQTKKTLLRIIFFFFFKTQRYYVVFKFTIHRAIYAEEHNVNTYYTKLDFCLFFLFFNKIITFYVLICILRYHFLCR